jgi:hypothetical protein
MGKAILIAASISITLLAGCAGHAGGVGDLRWDAGLATARDIGEKAIGVLQNHQYTIERAEGPPSIYVETRWRGRTPFSDEAAAGVTAADTRFIIEGRRSPRGEELYSVRIRAENRGRTDPAGDYEVLEPTPEFRAYANRIAADIRAELETGIRVIGIILSGE